MSIRGFAFVAVAVVAVPLSFPALRAADPPHVVFVIGEKEYRTRETLPAFARRELESRGLRCTFVHVDSEDPNHFPGLEALRDADLLFLSVRRRTPPRDQLALIREHLDSGKALVGIRTASHAFDRDPPDEKHARWAEFDREVLGGSYRGHYGNKPPSDPATWVRTAPGAGAHPILRGFPESRVRVLSHLYKNATLAASATPLLVGRVDGREEEQFVAWTNAYRDARVFYTSLGGPEDFELRPVRRLLVNAVFWALDRAVPESRTDREPPGTLELRARRRVEGGEAGAFGEEIVEEKLEWDARRTAIIICDMWNAHWCRGATRRVAEMAPRMNRVIAAARDKGVLIIHAPSGTLDFYADTPQRRRAQEAPAAKNLPDSIDRWCSLMATREKSLPIDDSDGGCDCEPPCPSGSPWRRQIETLEIHDEDAITDSGREVWNLFEARGIDSVILMGVHTNMCVLGRSFGVRNMARFGKRAVLMRDLTDTMYNSRKRPFVSHFQGTDLVVQHIEKFWIPTITSSSFTGEPEFRFRNDVRQRVAVVIAEELYDTKVTLPRFAARIIEDRLGHRATVLTADSANRHRIAGLEEALAGADLVILSVRRRALPRSQLDSLRAYLDSGKPLIALRTSSHAFDVRGKAPEGHAEWPRFDREVLGGNYDGHHREGPATVVEIAHGAGEHPILATIDVEGWESHASLYKMALLEGSTTPLLMGSIPGEPVEPLAWANRHGRSRIFYTSLGHASDFDRAPFRQLLSNAVTWALAERRSP